MWRKAAGPGERWRSQALAEDEEGTGLARKSVSPALNWSPSPSCLKRFANTKAKFSVFQKLESSSRASTRVPQKALAEPTILQEEEFEGCRERSKLASMKGRP